MKTTLIFFNVITLQKIQRPMRYPEPKVFLIRKEIFPNLLSIFHILLMTIDKLI